MGSFFKKQLRSNDQEQFNEPTGHCKTPSRIVDISPHSNAGVKGLIIIEDIDFLTHESIQNKPTDQDPLFLIPNVTENIGETSKSDFLEVKWSWSNGLTDDSVDRSCLLDSNNTLLDYLSHEYDPGYEPSFSYGNHENIYE